jgi:hypothetical protein
MQHLNYLRLIKLFSSVLFSFLFSSSYSQEPFCVEPEDEVLTPKSAHCDGPAATDSIYYIGNDFYVPDVTTGNTPIKTFNVNINVFQDAGGYNQFHENVPAEVAHLKEFITRLNNLYGSIGAPSDHINNVVERQDTRIRFDLGPTGQERIYYYKDTYLNRANSSGHLFQKIKNTDPNRMNNLNIVFNQSSHYERIKEVQVINQGTGYNISPIISFTQTGGGTGAVAYARVNSSGVIDAVAMKSKGSGYASGTLATITSFGGGNGAALQCFVVDGKIEAINVVSGQGGTGYPVTPTVNVINGSGGVVTCYAVNGVISSISIDNPGSGYLFPPKIIPPAGAFISRAILTSQINSAGQITGVTILYGGSGYANSTPISTIINPGSATIIPFVNLATSISGAAILSSGDIMNAPNLTVTGGGGTGATMTAIRGDNISGAASGVNVNSDCWIKMYQSYDSVNYATQIDVKSNTLNHEMAHNFDLAHLYGSETCTQTALNYLDDAFLAGTPTECPHLIPPWGFDPSSVTAHTDRYTNNIMGSSTFQKYFSPKQMGKMHRSVYLKSMKKYVKDCPYDSDEPIYIFGAKTWDFEIRVYNDIIVRNGATLTLTCKVTMPDNSKIVVERGGKLIVDGATITSSCGGMWKGIEVWGTSSASQYTGGMQYNYAAQGYLEIKNGAIIENAKDAIRTVKVNTNGTLDDTYTGGIVIATNSFFRNNRRAVEFRKYDNMYSGSEYNNVSVFRTCTLETTAQLKDPTVVPSAFISFWDVKGVEVRDNFFKCHTSSGYTGTNRGKGISSLDANYSIDKTTTGPGNKFENLDIGIEQGSGGTVTGTNYIKNNEFDDNRYGVYCSGTGTQPYVKDNHFDRIGPAVLSPATYGFFSIGVQGITVACNYFYDFTYGNLIYNTGTTSAPASNINNNWFFDNYRTIQTETNNSKLKLTYNDFDPFGSTQTHWYNTGPMSAQGAPGSPAANRFLGSPPPSGDIWNTSSANLFLYYYNVLTDVNTYPEPVSNVFRLATGITWTSSTWCSSGGGGGSLMAGGDSGGGEELMLSGGFEEIQGEQLYGEEAIVSEINDFIEAQGLDTNEVAAIEYLEELDNEQADWMLLPYYLGQENYTQAAELIETLNAENVNDATKLNYYRTISGAGLNGRNLSQLDSVEVSSLDVIAVSGSDVRDNARSVLHFFYGRNYPTEEISVSDIPLYFEEPILEGELVIPNIITPNGDGSNDVFVIENLPEHSSLTIFSNNGTQVYHSDSYANDWPPTTIPASRYYFSLILPDGTEQNSYFDVVY